jgi:hypothetical protein
VLPGPRLLADHRGLVLSAYLLIVRVFVAFSFLPCFNRFVVFFFAMPILLSFSVAARRFTPVLFGLGSAALGPCLLPLPASSAPILVPVLAATKPLVPLHILPWRAPTFHRQLPSLVEFVTTG